MRWREEIEELHAFFESYFLGSESSLNRADAAFAPAFTFIGANGTESDRTSVMQMLLDGHAHTDRLAITTTDHRLIFETHDTIVASYIEHHQLSDGANHRLSTVVFVTDPAAPNGLLWLRVHETWLP